MSVGEIISLSAALAAIVGVIVAIIVMTRNSKRSTTDDAKASGELRADIKYIKLSVDDLRVEQKSTTKQVLELAGGLGVVKRDVERAHDRIDKVEDELHRSIIRKEKNDGGR